MKVHPESYYAPVYPSRVIEQLDLSDRLELLVIEDEIYNVPTVIYEVHCWDCQGTDVFDDRDSAVRDGVELHVCRMAGEYEEDE